MHIKSALPFQTFNDGICQLYAVKNLAEKGDAPKEGLERKHSRVPFENRKVGIQRSYLAKQENVEITLLIRIPAEFDVSTQDVCIVNNEQYGIYQVQDVFDTMPKAKDLSLKRLEENYDATGL